MTAIVENGRFILADIRQNNNKFWNIVRTEDHRVETHYGRVGDNGQRTLKAFPSEEFAIQFYLTKCREKAGKGYQPVQTLAESGPGVAQAVAAADLERLAVEQIRSSSPVVRDLVTYLTRRNVHNILTATTMSYDTQSGTFRTPLGIVTAEATAQARALLVAIAEDVAAQRFDGPDLVTRINDYLMRIPQDIGHRRGRPQPADLFPDLEAVRRQNAILDALDASLQEVLSAPRKGVETQAAEAPPALFQVTLDLVEDGSEIDRIRAKFRATLQRIHECCHLDVKTVYMVEIATMRRAFEQDGAQVGNIWELWHGTRASVIC